MGWRWMRTKPEMKKEEEEEERAGIEELDYYTRKEEKVSEFRCCFQEVTKRI